MNITTIGTAITQFGGRGLLLTKKHSPQILTAIGIASGIASTVLATKTTYKWRPVIDDTLIDVDIVKDLRLRTAKDGQPVISEREYQKELTHAYLRGGLVLLRLYAPAISAGCLSVLCVVSAQGIMQQRNAGLTAAYVAAEKAFSEYRKRVEAVVGTDKEAALRYGLSEVKDEKVGDDVVTTAVVNPNGVSLYARFFDEYNKNWSKDPSYNKAFLHSHQQFANDLLYARGHVFLNEVYDDLGIDRVPEGQVVGWVLSKDGSTDNFIDFGLFDGNREAVREFVNGRECSILLDFNVDGVIFDKI